MSIDLNDEIIQDFLIEAGELLEQLDQQLVTLETEPDNVEILNAVFRNFHTIKGGAGFLAINPLVDICHQAENVFDVLRRGDAVISTDMMDSILQAYDAVLAIFEQIKAGEMPRSVDAALISRLEKFANPESTTAQGKAPPANKPEQASEQSVDSPAPGETHTLAAGHEITDDEFESLLDELHGKGKHTMPVQAASEPEDRPEAQDKPDQAAVSSPAASDEITDEEFELVLNELQKQKKGAFAETPDRPAAVISTDSVNTVNAVEKKSAVTEMKAGPKDKGKDKDKKVTADTTVRVETGTLDQIMNMVGELVLLRNRLMNLDEEIGHDEMSSTVANLDVVTAELQSSVMKTRMQPIKKVFGRFPRVVRDVARTLGKQVVLKMTGEDTDLDKNLVEALTDPLIHLVRNAVDHGIEIPEVRLAAGKPKEGTIELTAEQEGDHIMLKISDDGAGIDANALRRKVVENGLMEADAAERLSDHECYHFIFLPGLSTKDEVSDISGRGVGMDVVKSKINQLNGTILINSERGVGTVISIKVPLTLAIMPTLMVSLGNLEQIFALPLVNVNEILDLKTHQVNVVDGQPVLLVRGKPLPLYNLGRWLTRKTGDDSDVSGHVVVVSIGTSSIGLLVDRLLGREEVVIKPLGALLQGTKGMSGATVTGNGKIALILDLPSLVQKYSHIR